LKNETTSYSTDYTMCWFEFLPEFKCCIIESIVEGKRHKEVDFEFESRKKLPRRQMCTPTLLVQGSLMVHSFSPVISKAFQNFFIEHTADLRINILRRRWVRTPRVHMFCFSLGKNKPVEINLLTHKTITLIPLTVFSKPKTRTNLSYPAGN
jgi:hypothetical protein